MSRGQDRFSHINSEAKSKLKRRTNPNTQNGTGAPVLIFAVMFKQSFDNICLNMVQTSICQVHKRTSDIAKHNGHRHLLELLEPS